MIQKTFADKAVLVLQRDSDVIGVAVAGSWLTDEVDEFSDLDLILVTKEKISGNSNRMLQYAGRLGNLLSAFTGEHVGEPRLLICLYDDPLLHVDIKFLTLEEFGERVETPVILYDNNGQLKSTIEQTNAVFPYPDYQWIEDRFWTWIHYALLKIGRGEYLEAFDFLGFLRMVALGPLLHIKNNKLPRGVRKVEMLLPAADFQLLIATVPLYSATSLLESLQHAVTLYQHLRISLLDPGINQRKETEARVMQYFSELRERVNNRTINTMMES